MNLIKLHTNCIRSVYTFGSIKRYVVTSALRYNASKTESESEIDELDRPYPFAKSKAASWKAQHTREPKPAQLWYQNYVISLSMGVFMVYFFFLREENDVDRIFDRDLKDYFPNMTQEEFNKAMNVQQSTTYKPRPIN